MTAGFRTAVGAGQGARASLALALALAAAACTGSLGPSGRAGEGDEGTGAAGRGAAGTGAGGQSAASPIDPSPIARLTNVAYANTVRDLFPGIDVPLPTLPADLFAGDFDNASVAQTPSPELIEQYQTGAQAIAEAAVAQQATLLPCQPSSPADELSCGQTFLAGFAKRAFRRPPTSDEVTRLDAFFTSARQAYGFPKAISLALQGVLQSPAFLYRPEVGTPTPGAPDRARLTPYELASRLSYFLWNTMPDDELFAAAEASSLTDDATLEAQARRLLADPRAHAAVARFHAEWLEFGKMAGVTKDPTLFPTFTPEVVSSMTDSAGRFVERAFWQQGSLSSLLTDDHVYVDDKLAPFYGISASQGTSMTLVEAPSGQRSGILTQVGLLAAFGHETEESPVLRGLFVLDRFLCASPPPPPPNVNTTPPAYDPSAMTTTRQRFAQTHEQGVCAGCHHEIDGVGFGFEHYDPVGRWRDTEAGKPVDASGWAPQSPSGTATFDGAIDLGQKLAASRQVAECVTSKWVQYALGLDATGVTPGMVTPLTDALEAAGGDMRELLVAIVKSDTFRYRGAAQP